MSVSFEKHREQIVAAWRDVLDDKSTTDWALFGYEGQTNALKVIGCGDGGLEELCDDLNSGKIMYAFVRIIDPKTGLKKMLLINWQGEGAPVLRKGTCANHIHDVAKLLHGAHLTINARNEDDIDSERLLKKLSAVSSAYSFKEPRTTHDDVQKTPVGTNYTRVIPTKELNTSVMQDFWLKTEEEERRRIAAEKESKQQQLQLQEKEQRAREEKEHQEREKKVVTLSKLQPAHVPIKTSPQPLSPEKTVASFNAPALSEMERMRQQRNQEARELIGSRVGAAKAIFTKNTSEGQLQTKLNTAPPAKPARTSIAQRINAFNQPQPAETQQAPPAKIELPKAAQPEPLQEEVTKASITAAPIAVATNAAPIITENASFDANSVAQSLVAQPTTVATPSIAPAAVATASIVTASVAAVSGAAVAATTVAPVVVETLPEQPVTAEITAIANNDDIQPVDDYVIDPEEQYSTIKRSPHSKTNSLQSPEDTSSSNATDTAVYQEREDDDDEEEEVRTKVSITVQQPQSTKNGMLTSLERNELTDIVNEDDFICHDALGDVGMKARALYDYQAADESEITFDPGDIITHIDQIDEGWWQGLGPDGTYGLFPANYVEIIN